MYKIIASHPAQKTTAQERFVQVYRDIHEKYRNAALRRASINTVMGDADFSERIGVCLASAFLFATQRTILSQESFRDRDLLKRIRFIQVAHRLNVDPVLQKSFTKTAKISLNPTSFIPCGILQKCGLEEAANGALSITDKKDIIVKLQEVLEQLPSKLNYGILYFVNGTELHGLGVRIERASSPPKILLYDYQWEAPYEGTDVLDFYFASSAAFNIFNFEKTGPMEVGILMYRPCL